MLTLEAFLDAHLDALYRSARVLTGDRASAEDVLQAVLERATARWSRISAADEPLAYVRRMLVNEHLSRHRREGRVSVRETVPEPAPARDHAQGVADRDDLLRRLMALPARQRSVLVLRYYEGLDDAEIARVLGCGASTVRAHAARGLQALRLSPADEEPPGRGAPSVSATTRLEGAR